MIVIKILHYLALIFGFQASAFFTFFLIAESGADLIEGKPGVIPIMCMMIIAVCGYIWAISKPRKGSLLMITGGIIMAVYLIFIGGFGEIKMALIYGLPFIIPGLIFYFTAHKVSESIPEMY